MTTFINVRNSSQDAIIFITISIEHTTITNANDANTTFENIKNAILVRKLNLNGDSIL
jgi:hypothetical protein